MVILSLFTDGTASYQMNTTMQYFEVAAITSASETSDRCLKFKLKTQPGGHAVHGSSVVAVYSQAMEPLSYPLLFSRGELGWGRDGQADPDRDVVTFYKYLTSRLLMPERYENENGFSPYVTDDNFGYMALPSKIDPLGTFIECNRFQALARLGT
jgi:hypothetical protein